MSLLLKSVAGSHLYGLSRPESDMDYYEVHSELPSISGLYKATQSIVNGVDTTSVSLSHFIQLASSASHQALDAMFSENTEVDTITAFRRNFHVSSVAAANVYSEMIEKFAITDNPRKRKHSVRLSFNLADMMKTGRFNPTLSLPRRELISELMNLEGEPFYRELKKLVPVELKL